HVCHDDAGEVDVFHQAAVHALDGDAAVYARGFLVEHDAGRHLRIARMDESVHVRFPNDTVAHGDIAETGARAGAEFHAVADGSDDTIGDGDILAKAAEVLALEAERIVFRLNEAVGNRHIACVDIETI